jgi:predicted helicase
MSNTEKAQIFYKDLGDYFSREEKLRLVNEAGSILSNALQMIELKPNKHGDWIGRRNDAFNSFIPIGDKDNKSVNVFFTPHYSRGVATARDHFCWNYSDNKLRKNIKTIINFYNEQCAAYQAAKEKNKQLKLEDFISFDSTRITWNRGFKQDIEKGTIFKFNKERIYQGFYRPFCKQYVYFSKELNDMTYQMPKLFPSNNSENKIICISGIGGGKENTAIITDIIPDLNCLDAGTQCFPLYWYEKKERIQGGLFEKVEDDYTRHDAISDFILDQAHIRYGLRVTKEDIFYYVYGFLHSPDYQKVFANDLKKMLPRLPLVEKPADFWAFSQSGRKLADLHLNYEDQKKPAEVNVFGIESENFTVEKMKFATQKWGMEKKWGAGKWGDTDKSKIIYNADITISNIPEKAYEYIVNGKPAIEWIMERYAVTTHKESNIKNDPNDWTIGHNNLRYILDLSLSVIMVSIKTVDIVAGLPKVEWK